LIEYFSTFIEAARHAATFLTALLDIDCRKKNLSIQKLSEWHPNMSGGSWLFYLSS